MRAPKVLDGIQYRNEQKRGGVEREGRSLFRETMSARIGGYALPRGLGVVINASGPPPPVSPRSSPRPEPDRLGLALGAGREVSVEVRPAGRPTVSLASFRARVPAAVPAAAGTAVRLEVLRGSSGAPSDLSSADWGDLVAEFVVEDPLRGGRDGVARDAASFVGSAAEIAGAVRERTTRPRGTLESRAEGARQRFRANALRATPARARLALAAADGRNRRPMRPDRLDLDVEVEFDAATEPPGPPRVRSMRVLGASLALGR